MMTVTASLAQLDRLSSWEIAVDVLESVLAMSSHAESRSSATEDDRQDIRATLGGDGEAFGRLVARYQTTIAAQMQRF